MTPFAVNEEHLSQIPALHLPISQGYEYIAPGPASARLASQYRRQRARLMQVLLRASERRSL